MSKPSSPDFSDAQMTAILVALNEQGQLPIPLALDMCRHMGYLLQGIPKLERKRSVARLRNEADHLRQHLSSLTQARMIDALIEGWEDWTGRPD